MNKRFRLLNLLLTLAILVMTALITVSCSKSDDKDDNRGGGVKPDPDIPTLSKITYDLSQDAVIIPETTTKQLSSVDTLGHKLTLPTSAGKPEVGQCLIFNTPTKQLPNGLLAKVKSVTETNGSYQVTYEDAQLKDAFKNIDIPEQYVPIGDYVEHVYDADGKELKYQTKAKTRASGIKTFEIILPEIGWKIDKGIELTPKMSMDILLRYVFQFGDYELSYAGVKIDADVTVGADLNAELKSSKLLEKKFHILTVVCGAIPIGPVLLTPSIDMYGVVTIEGKITLEASISYERTLHASMIYQKGAGMTGSFDLEPEAPDALKFTFGPKFEGGIAYGLAMGGNIGVFGKTLAVRSRVNVVKKETISGKLDLAAFSGTLKDWLTPYDLNPSLYPDWKDKAKIALDYASKWNFGQFESIMYNQAIGVKVGWDLTTLGLDVASTNLPEMSIPISSVPICPQFKIDEKDFFAFDDNDVTLKLHHTGKSVLDDLAEFKAEFKPVRKDGKTIVKYFNFDDEIRNWLKAEVKGKDVTTTAKATLNGIDNYNVTVYMDILGLEIPIFEGYAKTDLRTDVNMVYFRVRNFYALNSSGNKVNAIVVGGIVMASFNQDETFNSENGDFQVTPIGNQGSFRVTAEKKKEEKSGDEVIKSTRTLSFTVDPGQNGNYGKAKDVQFNYQVYHKYGKTGLVSTDQTTHTYNYTMHLTDLPVESVSSFPIYVSWGGGYSDVKITKFDVSFVIVDDEKGETKTNFHSTEYLNDDLTSFYVTAYFPDDKK